MLIIPFPVPLRVGCAVGQTDGEVLSLHARHQGDPLGRRVRVAIEEEDHVGLGRRMVHRRGSLSQQGGEGAGV